MVRRCYLQNFKRFFLIIIVSALCLSVSVSAEYEEIHNEWHQYKDSFTIGSEAFSFLMSPGSDGQILFKARGFSWIIELDKCIENLPYKYCYADVSYDEEESTINEDGKWVPAVKIIIYKEEVQNTDVKFTHEYSISPVLDNIETFTLKIENEGDLTASNLRYEFLVPEGMEITDRKLFSQSGNKMIINANMMAGISKEFDFKYKPIIKGNYKLNYTYSFKEGATLKTGSGALDLNIMPPYVITIVLNPENIDALSTSNLRVILDNKNSSDSVTISKFLIKGPVTLAYSPIENLELSRVGEFKSKIGTVAGRYSKEFNLKILPQKSGEYNLTGEMTFKYKTYDIKESFSKLLKVGSEGLKSNFYLSKEDVIAGSNTGINFALGNENENLAFRNITVRIQSSFFNDSYAQESIAPNSPLNSVYLKNVEVPLMENDTTYDIYAFVTYYTESGEKKEFNKTVILRVTGSGELLSISKRISNGNMKAGEEVTVEVFVKNLQDETFNDVFVSEDYSKEGIVTFGKTQETIGLLPKEEKKAYTYQIKVPWNSRQTTFNTTTVATILNLGFTKVQTTTISVTLNDLREDDLLLNETPSEDDEIIVTGGDHPPQKKQNFFVKVFKSIESFFSKLFGKD